ncbi:MAG: Do family serine endopeptidase [Hyphomicrobiaceae bacterium]
MTRAKHRLPLVALMVALATAVVAAGAPAHARGPESIAPVAERLIDAVVNISTSQTVKGPQGAPLPKVPKGSPFEEFFDDFFSKKGARPNQDRKVSSLGSGFVIDGTEGLIVTNQHVIEGADEIIVNFHDGSKLKVDKVLGRDTKTDLALLKVTPKKPLSAVKFGSSETLKVGDWVLAIGNPFGLGGSVTVGIISAKQRDINSGPYDDYLQTDAAINKGNSGGPLFNMAGEVIGVNTAIISPTGGSIGIGFAVPSDTATSVVDQLRQFGETRRGWLGVKIQSVNEETAEALGIKENTGALVASISPASPAATAGLQTGDVVLKFDGKDVTTMRGLPRLVAQAPIGKTVDVEVLRKNERLTKQVVIGRLAEDSDKPEAAEAKDEKREVAPTGDVRQVIGLKLTPLTEDLRKKHGFDRKAKGILIVEIDPQSAAAKKNVRAGDLIVEAAQEPVATVADVQKAVEKVRKAGRKAILLRVEDSKGDLRFIAVPLS